MLGVGDTVQVDEDVAEIETDKVSAVLCPYHGPSVVCGVVVVVILS